MNLKTLGNRLVGLGLSVAVGFGILANANANANAIAEVARFGIALWRVSGCGVSCIRSPYELGLLGFWPRLIWVRSPMQRLHGRLILNVAGDY
jgi:hypothetical protein